LEISCFPPGIGHNSSMNEPENNLPPRQYKWPWFVLAMVLLGIVLAIVWMSFEVRKVEQERHPDAPVQAR
jgi:hypothetical protein